MLYGLVAAFASIPATTIAVLLFMFCAASEPFNATGLWNAVVLSASLGVPCILPAAGTGGALAVLGKRLSYPARVLFWGIVSAGVGASIGAFMMRHSIHISPRVVSLCMGTGWGVMGGLLAAFPRGGPTKSSTGREPATC
jgi:hypothetical protein